METKESKTVTVAEFIQAIRQNGLPKIVNHYFAYETYGYLDKLLLGDKIVGVCALGQAAINLGFDPDKTFVLNEDSELSLGIFSFAQELNDDDDANYTFEQIADELANRYEGSEDELMSLYF